MPTPPRPRYRPPLGNDAKFFGGLALIFVAGVVLGNVLHVICYLLGHVH